MGLILDRTVDCLNDEATSDRVRYDMQCTTSRSTRQNLNITLLISMGIAMFIMVTGVGVVKLLQLQWPPRS